MLLVAVQVASLAPESDGFSVFIERRDGDIGEPHQAGEDAVGDLCVLGRLGGLKRAPPGQSQAESTVDDGQGDEHASDPDVDAAPACPGRSRATTRAASLDVCVATLVDVVVDRAPEGLEEGDDEDEQADLRVRVRPDVVERSDLSGVEDPQGRGRDVHDVCEDLACGVESDGGK